ncbi:MULTISPECIES: endonuclease III [unclassified Nitratiruptor]|uniref:endonuclease III n=1 Tax=unclassified Nitratiruptor TaxID=2624044 RepID=UPI001915178A|nr:MULTISPECIES: endonuclease III [unclassified Nitratiruptor]BCD59859.1 endonuclease III [Nitratiruptor sp. YY08-10]BCD63782.1 endonuclease III [Nitratiruptor sp. YY08-14]
MVRRSAEEIAEIKKRLLEHYPAAKTELKYKNLYELLVAVMLSAQCTDKRVNMITPALFEKYPDIESLAKADIEDVKELIKTCSFFNNKAKNLVAMAKMVMEKYGGKIPETEKELVKLPGVGQKTAHVVMIEYFGKNLMAVDTHVFRVAHRLRLSDAKTREKTEEDLVKAFKTDLAAIHQAMVLFGRYICTAKNPKCDQCFLYDLCDSEDKREIKSE